jgi:uncharacterized Zn finger protein
MARTRGTCPHCGSGRVVHIRFGVQPADVERATPSTPDWVRYAGCEVRSGEPTRRCEDCGHAWARVGEEPGPP